MTETWESQRGPIELLSMAVVATGAPVAGESAALQILWLIALAVAVFLTRREIRNASLAST